MNKQLRWKVSCALLGVFALTGCGDILDVNNPNNLVEEDVQRLSAAAAVVNGTEALVFDAIGDIWEPYLVATDELAWLNGSRDAWGSLDQGFIEDPFNEFTDARFPTLAQARWMADYALEIVNGHVEEASTPELVELQARANLYAGIAYMIIGEVMQDFAFSDKQEGAPPVGAANMGTVFTDAIGYLTDAVDKSAAGSDLNTAALAVRARAKHSAAVRGKIQPTPNYGDPLVDAGADDALAVITAIGGVTNQWTYQATFSSATIGNTMGDNVNDRLENQIDPSLVELDGSSVVGVVLLDPIDNVPDTTAAQRIAAFRQDGESYLPLDIVNAQMMHLILAESALAGSDPGGFQTHINHVRDLNGKAGDYTGGGDPNAILEHHRRVNTLFMGLRLADMYRFNVVDPRWLDAGGTKSAPGTLLPITCIEVRANENLEGC